MPSVISVFPSRMLALHTTRSWGFLGQVNEGGAVSRHSLWAKADYGRDVIVGLLDTGVWPESESFNDDGMGPIPSRWKGICEHGTSFTASNCNRKLIGARYFIKGYEANTAPINLTSFDDFLSPRDKDGHGTHTASTAAGRFVQGANIFGLANGTASGGAPLSRLAIYKVCWHEGCSDADILAGIEAGLEDGVDVFSASLGSAADRSSDYFEDGISIGSFHAMQRNKLFVASAGNSGPLMGTVVNIAPWILTVAASSIDRDCSSYAVLPNNKRFKGGSLSAIRLERRFYPLVSGAEAKASGVNSTAGNLCFVNSLDPEKVKGKIVACLRGLNERVEKGEAVRDAGGVGMILMNDLEDGDSIIDDPHVLPATNIVAQDGASLFEYMKKTRFPKAYITSPTCSVDSIPAPVVASFSSPGPNSLLPDVLKPDITAPGVNILAAYSEAATATGLEADNRHVKYNVISGTSMSCPHIAGIGVLLKALHPDWSPAAIKSAIMTSAAHMDNSRHALRNSSLQTANPFNYGAGHVDPNAAADPGLVYDMNEQDYDLFLCTLSAQHSVAVALGNNWTCPTNPPKIADLNYPSISLSNLAGRANVTRTLTNVGGEGTYEAVVRAPAGIQVEIWPSKLHFSRCGERKSFSMEVRVKEGATWREYVFGHVTWTDGKHRVRSPIVVKPTSALE
eukprot:c28707_g1_i4 orf=29-2068(-)